MGLRARDKPIGRRGRRADAEAERTLRVAAQMALLCPSGMDIWVRRELDGYGEPPRHPAAPRR